MLAPSLVVRVLTGREPVCFGQQHPDGFQRQSGRRARALRPGGPKHAAARVAARLHVHGAGPGPGPGPGESLGDKFLRRASAAPRTVEDLRVREHSGHLLHYRLPWLPTSKGIIAFLNREPARTLTASGADAPRAFPRLMTMRLDSPAYYAAAEFTQPAEPGKLTTNLQLYGNSEANYRAPQ